MDAERPEALIRALEYGKKIRISVLPLGCTPKNGAIQLVFERMIHAHPYCDRMKQTRDGLERCMACKQLAVKKAVETGEAYGGRCVFGVWEAVCPVVNSGGETEYVVFVGGMDAKNEPQGVHVRKPNAVHEHLLEPITETTPYLAMVRTVADYIALIGKAYPALATSPERSAPEPIERAMLSYADAYFTGELSPKRLAGIFYMNEKYLGRRFKKAVGMSFNEYVNVKRLEKAAELLAGSEKSIIEVAFDCGFNNVTYFYRLFGKRYGVSPAVYRKNHRH